jgi:hypothetical protein
MTHNYTCQLPLQLYKYSKGGFLPSEGSIFFEIFLVNNLLLHFFFFFVFNIILCYTYIIALTPPPKGGVRRGQLYKYSINIKRI